ncbi:MAG: hypothetical protein JSR36_11780 [Proteobacteria bacterium]|nr:hypothetical protein [Pseudomonadota bacterium]
MRRVAWLTLCPLLGALGAAAAASPTVSLSELTHCAQIPAIDQRLACYDTLAASKMAPAATAAGGTGAAPAAAGGFGMSTHVSPVEESVKEITARVVNGSVDRQGTVYVALDNGQSWSYIDRDGPPANGSEVQIRRASLGSYLLTANHHTFRAQRTK